MPPHSRIRRARRWTGSGRRRATGGCFACPPPISPGSRCWSVPWSRAPSRWSRETSARPRRSGCAHVSIVPAQLRRLLAPKTPLATWADTFTSVLLGGAAAGAGLIATARDAGIPVVTTYGMSETCGGCVYDGLPLDGVAVSAGGDGRIRITGPVLFSGYRLRPDLTAAAFGDGWFRTSDLGVLDASGHVTVRGRADDVINTGGEKVVAGEVASVLETCPGVREAVVVGASRRGMGRAGDCGDRPGQFRSAADSGSAEPACAGASATLRCSTGTGAAGRIANAAERQTRSRNSPPGTIPGRKRY